MTATDTTTTDRLLDALRNSTGNGELDWARPPAPLAGGFWAEMYRIELADPPPGLDGRLVARIMPDPDPDTAALETAIQHHVHRHGLPVPAIRAAAGPTNELGRAWMIMDHAPGQPLLAGLDATTAIRHAPTLYRRLPDHLARAAAQLHCCPTAGTDVDDHRDRADINTLLARIAEQANTIERPDLVAASSDLADHTPPDRVICHGDLHPLNLLSHDDDWTLIDWSAAALADPHYDLAFTTLMIANPPLGGPAPVRAVARSIGGKIARRFLRTYEQLSGRPVDPDRLMWGQRVHALRALTELATWEHHNRLDDHQGHPWIVLRPALEARLWPRAQT